jgi:hypothetical protein
MSVFSIKSWIPRQWNQVVGNDDLVEHYRAMLPAMRAGEIGDNTMISGDSRTGKTAVTQFFVRCLMCDTPNMQTGDPCGECNNCKDSSVLEGHSGLFNHLNYGHVHFATMDCTKADADDVDAFASSMTSFADIKVAYLDEVDCLHRSQHHHEKRLLTRTCSSDTMWIASAVSVENLDRAFRKRFTLVDTQLPDKDLLALWLTDRCKEWGIMWDDEETLILLADKAKRNPGDTLRVLDRAYKKTPRLLTRKLVEGHRFIP